MTDKDKINSIGPGPSGSCSRGPVYAFPSRSRCPFCHSIETLCLTVQGRVQYRRCQRCGKHFKAIGWRV